MMIVEEETILLKNRTFFRLFDMSFNIDQSVPLRDTEKFELRFEQVQILGFCVRVAFEKRCEISDERA